MCSSDLGTVELDPDGQHLLIRFPYREDLVAAVKGIDGRRWDPKQKLWRIPATQVETVFAVLSRHLFEFAPEIPSLLAGTLRIEPKPAATKRSAAAPTPPTATATASAPGPFRLSDPAPPAPCA